MEEREILKTVQAELERAESFLESRISVERAAAYDYYYGKEFGNEVESRSRIVSGDVAQVIDSAVPAIVKVFVSGDKAVEFTPRGPEDVKAAELATVGCNYVYFSQNSGYSLAHDFIKDGLLQKIGVFKWKWDTSTVVSEKRYQGLTEQEVQILGTDPNLEVVSVSPSQQTLVTPTGEQVPLQDVVLKQKKEAGRVKIIVPPPEEILISPDAMSLDVMEMPFIAHTPMVTESDLVEMGISRDIIDMLPSDDSDISDEREAREERTGADFYEDESQQKIYRYNECYLKIDADGDGVATLHKICTVGDYILHMEEVDHIPMAVWTPKVMPHEVIGVSLADDVMDIQLLKSTIWRQALDNLYLSNAPRLFVQGDVNLDDVLTVKPGGVIRGEINSALTPITVPFTAGNAFQMLEYADQEEEVRTGISRMFQGIDPESINKTATGVNALLNQANARVELMARNCAEFGFKPLFKGILYLLAKHQTDALMVRLTNNFTPIDPETWAKEYDMSCNVGLGTGTKEQQQMQLQMLAQALAQIGQSPFAQQLLDAKKVFNLVQKQAELAGFKDVTVFLNDPEGTQPPPPQDPPEVKVAKVEQETSLQKAQIEQQGKQAELQAKSQLEQQNMAMQAELEKFKAELKAQTELQIAQIKAQMEHEREIQRCAMEHERGLRQVELQGKPPVQIGDEIANEHLKGAAEHLRSQSDSLAQAMAMLAQSMQLQAQATQEMKEVMARPRAVVRGKDGRVAGTVVQ